MGRHTDGTVLEAPTPEPPAARPSTTGDKVRFVLRGIGQTLITGGLIVLLFVFYEVYVTNWFADAAQADVKHELQVHWKDGSSDTVDQPDGASSSIPLGQGIANIYIPRLGSDYAYTIVQGTSQEQLEKGPGHYTKTALPGQVGNFAVAGHRVGKGEPFLNLDHVRAGDKILIETKKYYYVYVILGDPKNNDFTDTASDDVAFHDIPGREIVDPSDSNVLYPVPDHPDSTATDKMITLTTCHPKFTAAQRMILHGVQVKRFTKTEVEPKSLPTAVHDYIYEGL